MGLPDCATFEACRGQPLRIKPEASGWDVEQPQVLDRPLDVQVQLRGRPT
jgi:hypothetical protein